jgi:cytochrome P450
MTHLACVHLHQPNSPGHLLKVRHPATGQPLDMAQLKSELGIVLGAGFETTSHAITWTLAALATHPGVQVGGTPAPQVVRDGFAWCGGMWPGVSAVSDMFT